MKAARTEFHSARRRSDLVAFVSVLALMLAGGPIPGVGLSRATGVHSVDPIGRVDIGGRSLFIICEGSGAPTVVLENWLGGDWTEWAHVMPGVASATRVCAYDRAGIGWSDPPPTSPRTAADVVADLSLLLRVAEIRGPYVLVGHSFGGFAVRLYAGSAPEEVVGIVLVDPTPPGWVNQCLESTPKAVVVQRRAELSGRDPDALEPIDLIASEAQVLAAPLPPPMPVIVLTAGIPPMAVLTGHAGEDEAARWALQEEQIRQLHARHIVAERSGHNIPGQQPDLVVTAILEVVTTAGERPGPD